MPIFKKDILNAIKPLKKLDGTLYKFSLGWDGEFDSLFSSDFNKVICSFYGRPIALFVAWLKNISPLFKQNDSIEVINRSLKKEDIDQVTLPQKKEGLICLDINIADWTEKDFAVFLQKIAGVPIHRIRIEGNPTETASPVLMDFLEKLYHVDFIYVQCEHEKPPKKYQLATPLLYRNSLLKQLDIKPGDGVGRPIMENWMALDDPLDELHYLKSVYPLDGTEEKTRESKQPTLADEKKAEGESLNDLEKLYQSTSSGPTGPLDRLVTRRLMDEYVSVMGNEFLTKLFESKPPPSAKGFHFNTPLTKEHITQLVQYINQHGATIFFSRLWLKITDKEIIASKEFAELLQALQKTNSIEALHLVIEGPSLLECKLMDTVLPYIDYPIVMRQGDRNSLKSRVITPTEFQNEVIKKIQQKNIKRLKDAFVKEDKAESKSVPDLKIEVPSHSAERRRKKIKLKALLPRIDNGVRDRFAANYVPPAEKMDPALVEKYIQLEVQYVQVEEHQQQQQQQQQQLQETQLIIHSDVVDQFETEAFETYQGELITWSEFLNLPYSNIIQSVVRPGPLFDFYKHAEKELFWLFPMSPAAAMEIAKNAPAYSALNLTNLPQFFIRKKTKDGKWVLDYDAGCEERKCNVFTPKAFVRHDQDHIYTVFLEEEKVKRWMPDYLYYFNPAKLLKLWTKFGDEGCELFFEKLTACDSIHEKFSQFLYDHYLQYFAHWDHFLDNQGFFDSLEKVKSYTPEQLNCLKRFLKNTGPAKHDLKHTLEAFEFFWAEVQRMCQEQHVPINLLDTNWCTPSNGDPVVYMERLLTILKNARNLREQMECLDGIVLNRYGAYHASQYEGFKIVSQEMDFSTTTLYRDAKPFDPELPWYRAPLTELYDQLESQELDCRLALPHFRATWLIDDTRTTITPEQLEQLKEAKKAIQLTNKTEFKPPYKLYWCDEEKGNLTLHATHIPLPFAKFSTLVYRFIGQQTHGIKIKDYIKGATDKHLQYPLNSVLFLALFFLTHERYQGQISLVPFLNSIGRITSNETTKKPTVENLMELYTLGTYLSDLEGSMLIDRIAQMNSDEFESRLGFGKNKVYYSLKIFNHLKTNKYGTLKMISFLCRNASEKWPFTYAIDTAEYFATDPVIAVAYKDDLLLFSALINRRSPDLYHEENKAEGLLAKVNQIKGYLHEAASGAIPNNLDYAFKLLFQSQKFLSWDSSLTILKQVAAIGAYAPLKIDQIVLSNTAVPFKLSKAPPIFTRDDSDIKTIMIDIIRTIPPLTEEKDPEKTKAKKILDERELLSMDFIRLQEEVTIACRQQHDRHLQVLLNRLKDATIEKAFNALSSPFAKTVCEHVKKLSAFSDPSFEKINFIANETKKLVDLLIIICQRKNFKANEAQLTGLFRQVDFWKLEYGQFYELLELFNTMPQRDYFEIIQALFSTDQAIKDPEKYQALLEYIRQLDRNHFPSDYIATIIKMFNHSQYHDVPFKKVRDLFDDIIKNMIGIFKEHPKDPLFHTLLMNSVGSDTRILQWGFALLKNIKVSKNRHAIAALLNALQKSQPPALQPFLMKLSHLEEKKELPLDRKQDTAQKILEIIARSHHHTSAKKIKSEQFDYTDLIKEIELLKPDELTLLHAGEGLSVPIHCLYDQIKRYHASDKTTNCFEEFLEAMEKSLYGARPLTEQFSCAEVERVINQSSDLNNESKYTYVYRKQLMEAFLFVNEAGFSLALYPSKNGHKPAKDLSNQEIQAAFHSIKKGKMGHLTPFQQGLYALGLMREAMYRATGQFPYSTQIIALIDCLMADGHVISNIDTGQGKSWTDTMKAVLLWIKKGYRRVDITTSSIGDAKRDIERNSLFLDLLGVPYSDEVITAQTAFEKYELDGINYSTFPHLSLFHAKALLKKGALLGNANDIVGLIINESDHDILDERTIYRLAVPHMGPGKEWIYEAINAFISSPTFTQYDQTEEEDVDSLRQFLEEYAVTHGKSARFIKKFKYEQLLTWIESALIAKYHLRQKRHYIIPKDPELKEIDRVKRLTSTTKILNQDRRVEPEMTYGNGMQQLLYAHLNEHKFAQTPFIIEPENKTIISTNNKNLIDRYKARGGLIWGSSATVGSSDEIREQYEKYGFTFSKIMPHQKSQVVKKDLKILPDELKQFECIKNRIFELYAEDPEKVTLVFFKDIDTAENFENSLKFDPNFWDFKGHLQIYVGTGDEEKAIQDAGEYGMLTLTTSTLGRNTDVPYDRSKGMTVIQTFPDSVRGTGQKDGRTGRGGSIGTVEYILNEKDFGQEIDLPQFKATNDIKAMGEREFNQRLLVAFQTALDKKATEQRASNEALYDFLHSLLNEIESFSSTDFLQGTKEDFIKTEWSAFSEKTELDYKLSQSDKTYDERTFRIKKLQAFDHLLKKHVQSPARIEKKEHRPLPRLKYVPWHEEVKMSDCVSPAMMSYYFLKEEKSTIESKGDDLDITTKLKGIFDAIKRGEKILQSHQDYFDFLNSNAAHFDKIRAAHKSYLTNYLKTESEVIKQAGFFQRWFGRSSQLNRIANHQQYILLFSALSHLQQGELVAPKELGEIIIALLQEYLDQSWFLNSVRRNSVEKLIKEIEKITEVNVLIDRLIESQITMLDHDIKLNKGSYWRKIKRINFFGESRFQEITASAIRLASATSANQLDGKKKTIEKLGAQLTEVTTNEIKNNAVTTFIASKSKDNFMNAAHFLRRSRQASITDKGNMEVLLKNLNNAFETDGSTILTNKNTFS